MVANLSVPWFFQENLIMTPDQIKKLIDLAFDQLAKLKLIPSAILEQIQAVTDAVLPEVIVLLVPGMSELQIIEMIMSAVAGKLANHPALLWFVNKVVKNWIVKALPQLQAYQANPAISFHCEPFTLVLYPEVD